MSFEHLPTLADTNPVVDGDFLLRYSLANAALVQKLRDSGTYPPKLPPYTPATGQELWDSSRY